VSKGSNTYMPFYVADYLADTTMLTRDQHGAYLLLIMAYWRKRGPLPDRDESLAAAAKCTPKEWKAIRPFLEPYFKVSNGVWAHSRIEEELAKADEKYAARVNASRRANGVRHGGQTDTVTESVTESVTEVKRRPNGHRYGGSNGHRHGSQSESESELEPPNGGIPPYPPKITRLDKLLAAERQNWAKKEASNG
jgi:uncharacterized protein YdaU (DUF1376 family)